MPPQSEHARVLAAVAVRDTEDAALGTDGDGDERAALGTAARLRRERWSQRAQKREGLEVDAHKAKARQPAGLDVVGDQIAVGDDEKDALGGRAVGGGSISEDLEVEHGLVDRNRQRFLSPEADRVGELLRVFDAGDLDRANADAVIRDSDADVSLGQLVLAEELFERLAERLGVAHFAAGDQAGWKRRAGQLDDLD